ncbi:MAG TPA: hypothetical protein VGP95_01320 [Gemmatimonadaceae bacterium]|jgi:hypothetical protein|nr:hypothetical protein [Gemmatimonadaceae bacterium]
MTDRITLSVVLATIEPWPDLANCLAVLEPQVAAVGGEIIVGDGHGEALDTAKAASSERLSWVRMPGASVFELRARATERARGEIIAMTEDHVIVGDDWCAQILETFSRNPGADSVSGPVLNGSTDSLIDWANFLHTFGPFYPPVNHQQEDRCPPIANFAFRRSVVGPGPIATGWLELELNPRLFTEGRCQVSDSLTVTHVQSHGFWGTLRSHFDNGRSTTGLRSGDRGSSTGPWRLFRGGLRAMGGIKKLTPAARASLPLMFVLSCCHAAGEAIGVMAGAGRSPSRLR